MRRRLHARCTALVIVCDAFSFFHKTNSKRVYIRETSGANVILPVPCWGIALRFGELRMRPRAFVRVEQ